MLVVVIAALVYATIAPSEIAGAARGFESTFRAASRAISEHQPARAESALSEWWRVARASRADHGDSLVTEMMRLQIASLRCATLDSATRMAGEIAARRLEASGRMAEAGAAWTALSVLDARDERFDLARRDADTALELARTAGDEHVVFAHAARLARCIALAAEDSMLAAIAELRRVRPAKGGMAELEWALTAGEVFLAAESTSASISAAALAESLSAALLPASSPEKARSLSTRSAAEGAAGQLSAALSNAARACAIDSLCCAPEDPPRQRAETRRALLLHYSGRQEEALRRLDAQLEIARRSRPSGSLLEADVLVSLGRCYEQSGSYERSRTAIRDALRIIAEHLGAESQLYSAALRSLQTAHGNGGDRAGTDSLARQTIAIEARNGRNLSRTARVSRYNLGTILGRQGRMPETIALFDTLMRQETELNPGSSYSCFVEGALAECCWSAGQLERADTLFAHALAASERTSGPDGFYAREIRSDYVPYLTARRRYEAACSLGVQTASLRLSELAQILPVLDEGSAMRIADRRHSAIDQVLSILVLDPNPPPDARRAIFQAALLTRGLVFDELARRHALGATGAKSDSALLLRSQVLRREIAERSLLAMRLGAASAARQAVDSLRARLQQAELSLGRRTAVDAVHPFDLGELQRRLPKRSAVVSYFRFERTDTSRVIGRMPRPTIPSYLAFVLTSGDASPAVVSLGTASTVDSCVAEWRERLSERIDSKAHARTLDSRGNVLRRRIWDPIEARLGQVADVFVVPDGVLSLVPFDALPAGNGRYVIEKPYRLHALAHERDLRAAGELPRTRGRLLVVGGVDYDDASAEPAIARRDSLYSETRGVAEGCTDLARAQFRPLPASADEAREVVRLASSRHAGDRGVVAESPATLLEGAAATETAVKQIAPTSNWIHLATHGYQVSSSCSEDPEAKPLVRANPLAFSGMALAGANVREGAFVSEGEDGFLSAEELAGLDLERTECVVLSGCGTGLGELGGLEGVYGLPRALRLAGARSVVASLSGVDDDAARFWMERFYTGRFLRGRSVSEAAREASLAALRALRRVGRRPDPWLWGTFIAIGR